VKSINKQGERRIFSMSCTSQCNKQQENDIHKDAKTWQPLQELLAQYRGKKGSLVAILQGVQTIYGYLPQQVMDYIADTMKIKPAKIYGVATFYTQFRLKPVGKYHILLCQGTACHVNGSERILTAISEELKIKPDETTSDGLFTLDCVACLGCCSLAPVMMINGQAHGPLTPDKALRIIRGLTAQEQQACEGGSN
jgi:NADH-quinone oxidoreductase subunit E